MKRRTFSKLAFSVPVLARLMYGTAKRNSTKEIETMKAARLKKNDTIGLIAPGSAIGEEKVETAMQQLTEMGFQVKQGKHLRAKRGYLAGTDRQRLDDLHQMFADDSVQGIWCIRGGYGCTRLLPDLDYELIRRNPKSLIGFSDITALLHAIYLKTGLVGFHGPNASSNWTPYSSKYLQALLLNPSDTLAIQSFISPEETESDYVPVQVIHSGRATGTLVGGNLSLLAAMAGTSFGLDASGKLVCLEDVGEKPYRIDRMLTQLLQSAHLDKAAGIILGQFKNCETNDPEFSLTLLECLTDRLAPLGIPVLYGMSFGHIDHNFTIPIGVKASMDTAAQSLTLLESGVK